MSALRAGVALRRQVGRAAGRLAPCVAPVGFRHGTAPLAAWTLKAAIRPPTSVDSMPQRPFGSQSSVPEDAPVVRRNFHELGIQPAWVERLARLGIHQATATQIAALPPILAGKHVILKAETGSGKTLCYLLPILEGVRRRWSVDAPAGPAHSSATALIVVPTQELVHQIIAVARQLCPEAEHLFRAVYADKGVTRRDHVACIVATPTALKENVNFHQLADLQYLVLDEVDMLLSGTYYPIVQGYILSIFKQREPERRPQHIFCGATIPSKGKVSAQAFLDKYYPEPEVLRINTASAHKSPPNVRQLFVQLDASLPLTRLEREAAGRLRRAAATAADLAASDSPHPSDATPVTPSEDSIQAAMVERAVEDHALEVAAEAEAYLKKVEALRLQALLSALLSPAAAASADPTEPSASPAPSSVHAPSRPASRRPSSASSSLLVHLDTRAHAAAAPIERRPANVVPSSTSLGGHADVPTQIVPHANYGRVRTQLSAAEAAMVPPTLVFVNSADTARSLRKALAKCCPDLRVGELHKKVAEEDRATQLQQFSTGDVKVLVCTDVASRGLDTVAVQHVIQAEFASDVVTHLHRIGRTARAGRRGMATNLLLRQNLPLVQSLMHAMLAGETIESSFSRRRSFRKQLKKGVIDSAENDAIERALAEAPGGGPAAAT